MLTERDPSATTHIPGSDPLILGGTTRFLWGIPAMRTSDLILRSPTSRFTDELIKA